MLKPNADELAAIQDHLNVAMSLKQQINQLRAQFLREHRDLEIAFSNAVRRDMLERGVNEPVPTFFGDDGGFNMQIGPDGTINWVEAREPKGE